jgi:hypothetical protein
MEVQVNGVEGVKITVKKIHMFCSTFDNGLHTLALPWALKDMPARGVVQACC